MRKYVPSGFMQISENSQLAILLSVHFKEQCSSSSSQYLSGSALTTACVDRKKICMWKQLVLI